MNLGYHSLRKLGQLLEREAGHLILILLRESLKTVGFHFTTWPNLNIREISFVLLKISIPFLVLAWPSQVGCILQNETWDLYEKNI